MDTHLLTEIEIKDFKCFKDFRAEGFKRVNLIGGKNNVGKTAFMEACYIYAYPLNSKDNSSMALADTIFARYAQDFFTDCMNEKGIKYLFNQINSHSKIYENANINGLNNIYIKDDFLKSRNINNVDFIFNEKQTNQQIEDSYAYIIEKKLETEIDKIISLFDESIESFRIIKSEPKCRLKENGIFYSLNEFGEGLHKYITYILELYSTKDGVLFIDEVDSGLHYSIFNELWEIILKTSKEQNVQVFATTHSKECIESYVRVSQKLEEKDISFIELGRNKENELKAIVMDEERLSRYIKEGNEVRGW